VIAIGTAALYGSFLVLSVLVAAETVVLLEVLRRVVRLKQEVMDVRASQRRADRLPQGTFIDFSARDLTRRQVVRASDLRGSPAALVFVKATGLPQELPGWLADTFAGLRAKGHEALFVMCEGELAHCSALAGLSSGQARVLQDGGGEIRQRFLITSTPAAVLLDGRARVGKYGSMEHSGRLERGELL